MDAIEQPAQAPPRCRHLRSKAYYMDLPVHPSGTEGGVQACWCFRTQQALGPDGEPANPRACDAGRRCYEADEW